MRLRGIITVLGALLLCAGCADAKVKHYRADVVKEYPHDRSSYTQGLFFHQGKLYETTGQYGSSTLRIVNLQDGTPSRKLDFSKKYFVEGSAVLGDRLYILTWTNKVAFIYDASTLGYISTVSYPREGWGLTTDGKSLIASDGSSVLYFMDEKMKVQRTVTVKMDGRPINYLNELEYIGGKIWANVYTSDLILIINPSDGLVEGVVDCTGLLPEKLRRQDTDVLNGIAENDGKIYLTGKNWPKMYQVELIEE